MPFLHKYLGNPVLSFLGRLFFSAKVGDFHCGLRGFNRERMLALDLRTTGMEFASEMVVRAALAGYAIAEVPTTLKKDGRTRAPHLNTWRDGWRHLRFLLMYRRVGCSSIPACSCSPSVSSAPCCCCLGGLHRLVASTSTPFIVAASVSCSGSRASASPSWPPLRRRARLPARVVAIHFGGWPP